MLQRNVNFEMKNVRKKNMLSKKNGKKERKKEIIENARQTFVDAEDLVDEPLVGELGPHWRDEVDGAVNNDQRLDLRRNEIAGLLLLVQPQQLLSQCLYG